MGVGGRRRAKTPTLQINNSASRPIRLSRRQTPGGALERERQPAALDALSLSSRVPGSPSTSLRPPPSSAAALWGSLPNREGQAPPRVLGAQWARGPGVPWLAPRGPRAARRPPRRLPPPSVLLPPPAPSLLPPSALRAAAGAERAASPAAAAAGAERGEHSAAAFGSRGGSCPRRRPGRPVPGPCGPRSRSWPAGPPARRD